MGDYESLRSRGLIRAEQGVEKTVQCVQELDCLREEAIAQFGRLAPDATKSPLTWKRGERSMEGRQGSASLLVALRMA